MLSFNRLLKDLGRITYDAVSETHPTLESQLEHLLIQMIDNRDGVLLLDTVRELTHDVVYFVLNTIELGQTRRAFVAGMNWANLNEDVKNGRLIENCQEDLLPVNGTARIFSTNSERLSQNQDITVGTSWKCIWAEYSRITTVKASAEMPLLTLNHWLLNFARNPQNIGFYWGNDTSDADDCYLQLNGNLLQSIGLFPVNNFYQVPIERQGKKLIAPEIVAILNSFRDMDCTDKRVETPESMAFCIYHLLRSYGCWGGTAFLSIPVVYGNRNFPKTGVLSVCTTKPMNQVQVMLWSLVANTLFKDIMFANLDKLVNKAMLVQSTYGIGHLFKTRTALVLTDFDAIREDIKDALNHVAARLDALEAEANDNLLLENVLQFLRDKQREIELQSADVRTNINQVNSISNVLDIISRTLETNDWQVFLEKDKWHARNPLNFSQGIETWAKHLVRDNKKPVIRSEIPFPIQIECFIPDGEGAARPADFLYEETVAEIIINGLKHGRKSGKNSVDFTFGYDAEEKICFLGNLVNDDEWSKNEKRLQNGELKTGVWLSADSFSFGGIYYLHRLFKQTRAGELFSRISKTQEGEFEFAIGFKFEGLMSP